MMKPRSRLRLVTASLAALLVGIGVFAAGGGAAQAVAPVNTVKPTISGTARQGETLTASNGTWTGTPPISYTYQWIRCSSTVSNCNPIPGATNNTYALTSSDVGQRLIISVTATNADGASTAQSDATDVVATQGQAPANTAKPGISGTAREGETLTAANGTWTSPQPISYSYQWIRCSSTVSNCSNISGATSNTYTLVSADVSQRIIVSVRASNSAGASSAQSDATPVVVSRGTAPASTARPTISGTPKVGETLTAANGTWTGTQPITYSYQWQRCDRNGGGCANIAGATGQSYRLTDAGVGRTLRVVVTARNATGTANATSVPTEVIATAGPAGQIRLPNGKVSIPVTSVVAPARLIIDRVSFSPNPVRSRNGPITARFRVSDTRGYVIRGALVFLRSTPLVTSTPPEQATGQDGMVAFQTLPQADFPLRTGFNVQFFVRARKQGDNVLAGVSTRRLVQVRTATPS